MTGLRYSPLHVTEFCGEMQGKFKVGFARLTRSCSDLEYSIWSIWSNREICSNKDIEICHALRSCYLKSEALEPAGS